MAKLYCTISDGRRVYASMCVACVAVGGSTLHQSVVCEQILKSALGIYHVHTRA